MTGKTRYTKEFQAKALRLPEESRANHSSETKAVASVAQSLGAAPETLRRWRNKADRAAAVSSARAAEETAAELKRLRAEVAELRKANEILTAASAFSRPGSPRHGVEGRVHRRLQGLFRGRADLQRPVRGVGLRVPNRDNLRNLAHFGLGLR